MKNILFSGFSLLLLSCASAPQPSLYSVLRQETCPDFAGYAVAETEKAAIDAARAQIASEIKSSITVSSELVSTNINREASSAYRQQIISNYSLDNASDAKLKIAKQQGNEFGVVVCMSKADAAKGFLEQQRLITDSLEIISGTVLNSNHPKQKNEAWRKTSELYNRFVGVNSVLDGWGIKSIYPASEIYAKARDNYKEYCQNQKIYWEDAFARTPADSVNAANVKNECFATAFSQISGRIKVEKSECLIGFKLSFSCAEKCGSSSMGAECSFEPSLAIESCEKEPYSLLKVKEPVRGYDMNNQARAREKLAENFKTADFFDEWQKEITEWVPQCAE